MTSDSTRELEYSSVVEVLKERAGKVLFFGAHPDDITVMLGGTVKRAVKTVGAGFVYATIATLGEKGMNRLPYDASYDEAFVRNGRRQEEETESLKTLGVSEEHIVFLGLPDGGVTEDGCIDWLSKSLSYFSVVVTLGPVNDGHPDHQATHRAVVMAREQLNLTEKVAILALNADHTGRYSEEEFVADKFTAAAKHRSQYPVDSGWLAEQGGKLTMGPKFVEASPFYPPLALRETYDLL